MQDPTSITTAATVATSVAKPSFLEQLFQGPCFAIIIVFVTFIGISIWQDRKEKTETRKVRDNLKEGTTVVLSDKTVGEIISIDREKGIVVIKSAETQLQKKIEAITAII